MKDEIRCRGVSVFCLLSSFILHSSTPCPPFVLCGFCLNSVFFHPSSFILHPFFHDARHTGVPFCRALRSKLVW